MIVVLSIGVGFAALKGPSRLWASALFTVTLAVLLGASFGAVARRGLERMAWIGFAVFGWSYLILSFWLLPWLNPGGDLLRPPPLLAEQLLDDLHPYLGPAPPPGSGPVIDAVRLPQFKRLPSERVADWTPFRQVGNSLGTILFAFIGALLGRLFGARDDRPLAHRTRNW
jgi:hypothetical protein